MDEIDKKLEALDEQKIDETLGLLHHSRHGEMRYHPAILSAAVFSAARLAGTFERGAGDLRVSGFN